ncbi:hypothetical protein N658DRAFT_507899 [Parathielavia hyrcaniae]|uniref:Letm1 RBD domain-containing protein n=1 Tax=Parathielavia hyrcaniae TaxID=113614 RepID=A0AAN6Q159_9PEZI|nr:hypothetical protein N658DRAFT_507899 [Parathielavia hyrcaniae]
MRHSALIGSALRVNCLPSSRQRAQPSTIILSLSKELSRNSYRPYSSASPNPRRPQPPDVAPSAANPPSTTRPPPLDLPPVPPPNTPKLSQPYFAYLLALGKAYLKFYKTGIRHVYTNTRLLYSFFSSSSPTPNPDPAPTDRPHPSTRAHLHLRERVRHDLRRLPLFALMLLVCGEFTPLVVLALPGAVPLPCRIPRQVEKLLAREEGRRVVWRDIVAAEVGAISPGVGGGEGKNNNNMVARDGLKLRGTTAAAGRGLAMVLGLSAAWRWMPGAVVGMAVEKRLRFLAVDDALLVQAGGAAALVPEEVRLTCAARGIDVLGRGDEELRGVLGRWLRLTDARRLGEEGRRTAVAVLLGVEDRKWNDGWEREFIRFKD